MPKITVPRADLTPDEVSEVLRDGLGPSYNVIPGMRMTWNPFGKPHPSRRGGIADSVAGMESPGPLLASGRDSDIFEYGRGLVLRRSRVGRSLVAEARIMRYLTRQGYPVPAVREVSENGAELVMERIDGPSMVDAIGKSPWKVRRFGRLLAELHHRLHAVAAPDDLPAAPMGEGRSLLHMDLHPLNVIIGPNGPVVIDWTNASKGDPCVDVGLAWVLMSAGEIPGGTLTSKLLGLGRGLLVNSFTAHFDLDAVRRQLPAVVEWKARDPHMSSKEIDNMWRLVKVQTGRTR